MGIFDQNMSPQAVSIFSALQSAWGQPLKVNSAYRSPEKNAAVGGAKHSQHMQGNAYDIDVSGMSEAQRLDLIAKAKQQGFKGVGVYNNALHFDVGPERAWGPNYHGDSIPEWARGAVGQPAAQAARAQPQERGIQPMAQPQKPEGLLAQFGMGRQDPNAQGQMAQPFYKRDNFKDFAGNLASGFNSMRLNPDENLDARLAQKKQGRESEKQKNRTKEWLIQNGRQDLADAIGGGLGAKDALGIMYGKSDGAEYGLTPQYITDADGNLKMIQLSKDGTAKEVALPDGAAIAKGVEKLDLGTSFQWYNTLTGEAIGAPIPKDLAGAEKDKALGKGQGEAAVSASNLDSKMSGLQEVVGELSKLADEATYTMAGQASDTVRKELGMGPSQGAVARTKYISIVDNQILPLLRDTFGAQFTVKEGEALRATLGDPNKTPIEKQAVLEAFIEQKQRNLQAFKKAAGGGITQSPLPSTGTDPLGLRQ